MYISNSRNFRYDQAAVYYLKKLVHIRIYREECDVEDVAESKRYICGESNQLHR